MDAIFARFIGPPGAHNVERKPAAAADLVDVSGLFREERGGVESRAHGDHELEAFRYRHEGGRGAPGVEGRSAGAFDVVEI